MVALTLLLVAVGAMVLRRRYDTPRTG
ncbi:hypothetical protein ACFL6M_03465 [Candidatus Eisenbacteria bacterium]|uniref:LPXTG cell wall anchor domain-containing protein n=1 Tax=Eiseniibacteriota bacterium TaxID=2212470 RepID=A0ABV6YJY8_UNCEI